MRKAIRMAKRFLSFFHYDDLRLEAGKRYMASLQLYSDVDGDGEYEFCLSHGLATSQYDKDGNRKKVSMKIFRSAK